MIVIVSINLLYVQQVYLSPPLSSSSIPLFPPLSLLSLSITLTNDHPAHVEDHKRMKDGVTTKVFGRGRGESTRRGGGKEGRRGGEKERRRRGEEERGERREERGERIEDRGQRTEDRGPRTEDRGTEKMINNILYMQS